MTWTILDPAQLGSGLDMVLSSDQLNGPALTGPGQGGVCLRDSSNLHPAALRCFSPFGGIKQTSFIHDRLGVGVDGKREGRAVR